MRTLKIAGAGLLAAGVVGIGIGYAAASAGFHLANPLAVAAKTSASPAPSNRQALCQDFVNNLAKQLKTTPQGLVSAVQAAADKTVDDLVAEGKLTSDQAARIKAAIARRAADPSVCRGIRDLRPGPGGLGNMMQTILDAAATALKVTPDTLKADLQNGMSLHQVADSKGISESQFRTALIAALKPEMDKAVSNGKLTQSQENQVISRIQNGPIPFWDYSLRHMGGPFGPFGPGPQASPAAIS